MKVEWGEMVLRSLLTVFEQISLRCSTAAINFIPALSGATGPVNECGTQSCDYSYIETSIVWFDLSLLSFGVQVIKHNFTDPRLLMLQQATYNDS